MVIAALGGMGAATVCHPLDTLRVNLRKLSTPQFHTPFHPTLSRPRPHAPHPHPSPLLLLVLAVPVAQLANRDCQWSASMWLVLNQRPLFVFSRPPPHSVTHPCRRHHNHRTATTHTTTAEVDTAGRYVGLCVPLLVGASVAFHLPPALELFPILCPCCVHVDASTNVLSPAGGSCSRCTVQNSTVQYRTEQNRTVQQGHPSRT